MDPYNMPKGFTAHLGRHENRLSRPVMPFGSTKLAKFNAERREKGLQELHPTKGWYPPPRKKKPATGQTKAQELIYAFLGYW